jgi:uncharacterized protein YkwD
MLPALAIAMLAFAAAPGTSSADASACTRWGGATPDELSKGQARKTIVCLVNKERDRAGLSSLDRNHKLQKAAQRHNERMDGTGCFDHQCPGEAALDTRLESVDYLGGGLRRWVYGENLAWGFQRLGTPKSMVDAWMHSPGHRANILNGDFREIGVGFSSGTPSGGGDPGGIYTTDFGLTVG